MCGEKPEAFARQLCQQGSPPRVRGKVGDVGVALAVVGITPAYAGKRSKTTSTFSLLRDHPRVCGEKRQGNMNKEVKVGSPPRVRGKVDCFSPFLALWGITPAYAGKRRPGPSQRFTRQDHPRVCGEKVGPVGCVSGWLGSPPRMRGKAEGKAEIARTLRITPAYAGKRIILHRDDAPSRDHPRVCGEKAMAA